MARFKFCMIGTSETPILHLPAANVRELNEVITRSRFIEGDIEMTDGVVCGMLLSVNRIQCVIQLDECHGA